MWQIWECIRIKLGLILGVIDLGVYWGKFGISFGCVKFEAILGSILAVKHFGDVFGKKLRLTLGLILNAADLRDALKPSLGLTLGELDLG